MISIIIPTLNEEKYILKTLQSLQEFRRKKLIEIIVVDGFSTDNTKLIEKKFCNKVITEKAGRANQLNTGAALARYDLLLFLHADTIIGSDNISELLRKYETIKWGFFNLNFYPNNYRFSFLSYCINLRSKLFKYGTGDQCLFVKRKLFNQIHGFGCLNLMEDIDLSRKLLKIIYPNIMESTVYTSARKWIVYGYLRTIIKMRLIRLLYHLGISTKYLEKIY